VVQVGDTLPAVGEFVTAEEAQRRIAAAGIRLPRQARLEDPAAGPGQRSIATRN
jgi:hypothetical protein